MGKLEPASDPSMEDILASIRRIIADDDGPRRQPVTAPHLSVVERPFAPIVREPGASPAMPPLRFDASPLAATEPALQPRTLAETVALATTQPPIVVRASIAPSAPAAAAPMAYAERPAAAAIPPTTPGFIAAPVSVNPPAPAASLARPEPAPAVRAESRIAEPTSVQASRQESAPAFPSRSAPLSQATIEIEVARLLASPRPPDVPRRAIAEPHPVASAPIAPPAASPPAPVVAAAVLAAPVVAAAVLPAPVAAVTAAHASTAAATTPPAAKAHPGLMSPNSDAAVRTAFDQLADTMFSREARSLEDVVKDMMRPMLRDWLDDNLPPLVERLVREEIQRVSRGRK